MARGRDPYVYKNSKVLRNKEGIRDAEELESFEHMSAMLRYVEGLPAISITAYGYCRLHHHLFQDVYGWAGQIRTVDMAKNDHLFCRSIYIETELDRCFAALQSENCLQGLKTQRFAERAGEHISEINAIHPFREGNGRTMRAFLEVLGTQAGHEIELRNIDPDAWNEASRVSFRTGDAALMRDVIAAAIVNPTQRDAP